jgi:hypothetical protein
MKHFSLAALALAGVVLFSSCKKDDDNNNAGSAAVSTLSCAATTFSPSTVTSGNAYVGTASVQYLGGNGAAYAAGTAIASTGVTGLTATLRGGTLTSASGNLIFDISGTPSAGGTAVFAINFGGKSCSINMPVVSADGIVAKWQWINYVDSIFFISSTYGRTTSAYNPSQTTGYNAGTYYDLKADNSFDFLVTSSPANNRVGTYTYTGGTLSLLYSDDPQNPFEFPVMGINLTSLKLRVGALLGADAILDTVDLDNTIDSVDTYELTRTRNLSRN